METITSLEILFSSLKDIINDESDAEQVQQLIIKLHYNIQKLNFQQEIEDIKIFNVLENIAIYFLSLLTNITCKETESYVSSFYTEGLNLSGTIIEYLSGVGFYNEREKITYLFMASSAYSLAGKEANSAVIANKLLKIIESSTDLTESKRVRLVLICKTLSRDFRWICNARITTTEEPWNHFAKALLDNSRCLIDGNESSYFIKSLNHTIAILYKKGDLANSFLVSLLVEVIRKMHSKSVWTILRKEQFENRYIETLTKYGKHPIYEIWDSQLSALKSDTGKNYLDESIKRVIISMPTSAGKSFLAELAIVKQLQLCRDKICIYVAPSKALVSEIEEKLFYRLRRLGYRVSAILDTDSNYFEDELIERNNILVVTPEKLDLLLRRDKNLISRISLILFDEFHKISNGTRGWLLETLLAWCMLRQTEYNYKLVLMSAVVSSLDNLKNWLGNEIKLVTSNWSPTRRLYGIASPAPKKRCKFKEENGYRYSLAPYDIYFKYCDSFQELPDIFPNITCYRFSNKAQRWVKDSNRSDTKFDRSYKLINRLRGKILIYFFRKEELISFIEYAKDYLEKKDTPQIRTLQSFLASRLGLEHPLTNAIAYGVAYHHGDLPTEVRREIEKGYKNGSINILACTTTLADGVNLPIKNFILGSMQNYNGSFSISLVDYKNIVGRAGRAYIETEGKVFLVRHPDYQEDGLFGTLVNIDAQEILVNSALTSLNEDKKNDLHQILDTLEQVDEALSQEADSELQTYLDRLQAFVFSISEYFEDVDLDNDEINYILHNFLFSSNETPELVNKIGRIFLKYYKEVQNYDRDTIGRFNKTGLSFMSNLTLLIIAYELAKIKPEEISLSDIISSDVYNRILSLKEIKPKKYEYKIGLNNVEYQIDHYGIFKSWINGDTFLELRDNYFAQDPDVTNRTQICVNYINDIFLYKLPWALSAFYVISVDEISSAITSILKDLPARVKYGVSGEHAVKLCTLGIDSRELASQLANLYLQYYKDAQERPDIEQWLIESSFFYFERYISSIDDIAKRQIARVRTKIRPKSKEFETRNSIITEVMGINFYGYATLSENSLPTGSSLVLVREPENLYDEYAVRVETINKTKLGYIPSKYAEEVFEVLEVGETLNVTVRNAGDKFLLITISRTVN